MENDKSATRGSWPRRRAAPAASIAISALETLGDPPTRPVEIFASDISAAAIERAQEARYRGRALLNVAPAELSRYFTRDGDSYVVRPGVRELVRFEQHNLQEPFPPWARALDIIFCQNVTIYFGVETCRALMSRFYESLTPGGYLVLGYSETLWRIFDRFESVEVAGAFVYRKPLPRVSHPARRLAPERAAVHAPPPARRVAARDSRPQPQPAVDHLEQGLAALRAGALDAAFIITVAVALLLAFANPLSGRIVANNTAPAAAAAQ